jgi:galactokinase
VAGFAERRGLPAFDLALATSVPIGAGLSSSASLEVAVATLIENMTGAAIGPIDKARLCQRAEHEWAGVPCGIMDQLVSVLGREGHALLIDCRTLDVTHVPMPADAAVVVADTGVRHELAAGEYAKRRAACSSAAAKLGIASLREATSGMADDPCLEDEERRCVRHVTTENERVLRAVEAMRAGDLPVLGRLMNDSHESLRRDYRVSCAELDALVGAARSVEGVLGARMTGGGFGGCAVVLTTIGAVHGVVGTLRAHSPSVAWMRASHGARTTKA